MQGQYLFGDIPMDPNDDALHPPWVTIPNAAAQFTAFGLGPTPYTAPPDAPSNASVGLMPPLPMFGAMPNDFGLPGLPSMSAPPSAPQGGHNGGFGFSDIALPLAAGLAGAASGYATHGNPQTVLQGLSLAHRAQLMPRPEQLQQQQQQKMIHDLIMSGKLSPQALQRLGQQYPWAAPYTEAMLPTAQRQARLQSFVEGQIPGFNGTPPPAPVEPVPTGAQYGPSLPAPAASAAPGASSAQGFAYLPDMSMDSKGDVTMGVKPHQLPKPTDLEQRLQAIRGGQAKSPDERIALGLEKPLEEPPALQSNRAIDVIDQQIQTLSQQMQTNPHPLLERRLTELMNTRDMLAQKNAFEPKSPTGQNLYDLQTVQRLGGDPYAEQTQRAATTASSRIPMDTAQGKAGEDVRMLQQGRNMNAGDPQLQSQQAEADAASLGKDVGNVVFQRQGLDSVTKQYGPDSNEAKDATTVYNREVLKNQAPKPTDIAGLRGDFMQQTKDFNVTRDFYRQVEQVLRTGGPNAMGDISFITAMAKILDPGSVVRPSESGQIEVNSRTMPESIKLYLSNLINDPKLLTAVQRRDLVDTVRQAYVSRLQSVDQLKQAYGSIVQHQFPGVNIDDITGTVPYDAIDLAYLRGRPATNADIAAADARANAVGKPALAPMLLLQQGINPFADMPQ